MQVSKAYLDSRREYCPICEFTWMQGEPEAHSALCVVVRDLKDRVETLEQAARERRIEESRSP